LSDKEQSCFVLSDHINVGDGIMACQENSQVPYVAPTGYSIRDTLDLVTLDSLVDQDIWLLKIDVEGFEPLVFRGAKRLFATSKIHYIFSEVSDAMMAGHGYKSEDYMMFLYESGFMCSLDSFDGPYFSKVLVSSSCLCRRYDIFNFFLLFRWC
jgi:hypothetical protein